MSVSEESGGVLILIRFRKFRTRMECSSEECGEGEVSDTCLFMAS